MLHWALQRSWPQLRSHLSRLIRGAMLTPWFAVSVGIVIATTLTLARPHPALTFPRGTTGRCATAPCVLPSTSPSITAPQRAATRQGVILPPPGQNAKTELADVTVGYEVLYAARDQFTAAIVIVSHRSLGRWQLKFSLPGATVSQIMWAEWRSEGRDRLVVTGEPAPWPVSADHSAADQARIILIGTGTPAWPAGCRFDGAACRFRPPRDDRTYGYR